MAHALEFRAGKLLWQDNNSTLVADVRKGLFRIEQRGDKSVQVTWRERDQPEAMPEERLVVRQGEAEFIALPQCTTGKAFVLKFHASFIRLFFWIQEPNLDAFGSGFCDAMNAYMSRGQGLGGLEAGSNIALMSSNAAHTIAKGSSSSQVPAKTFLAEGGADDGANRHSITLNDLDSFFSSVHKRQRLGPAGDNDSSLMAILNVKNLQTILEDGAMREALFPFIPASAPRDKQELESIIRSPQFVQAVKCLEDALRSGQVKSLMCQFGLNFASDGPVDGIDAFLRAIIRKRQESAAGAHTAGLSKDVAESGSSGNKDGGNGSHHHDAK